MACKQAAVFQLRNNRVNRGWFICNSAVLKITPQPIGVPVRISTWGLNPAAAGCKIQVTFPFRDVRAMGLQADDARLRSNILLDVEMLTAPAPSPCSLSRGR